ncbi:patatin-like phospholipase family protein [Bradyrhizobium sp. CB3481]|uniref:patatin-like phospholipase family protein n=1 Tax=Bradyrhizobium sp. CB3481 TaxID=3039158 RepID=UPI0024B1719E|nr:patatin-like phospholipase family protein [Bradyrhizobium sp. CB3481]WFU14845.1 patatin-like phospholipase family protein [Bradyrhizobium sp. CB3481]
MTGVGAETDKDEPAPSDVRSYRVLSVDGGGMRGIYTAAFLDRLVTQFARTRGAECLDLGKGFDLITGTSTGAIVASALAVGLPMAEIVNLYRCHGRQIFSHRIKGTLSAIWRMFVGGRYVRRGDAVLHAALTEVLKETTMLDVFNKRGISLSIPAVLMSSHRSWVFKKTPASGVRDDHYKLVDVCMASSAAPIFRSLAAVKDPNGDHGIMQVFADGGLWANNPIMVGLVDALQCAPKDAPIEIFSLGTCSRPEGELIQPWKVHRSILGWKMGRSRGSQHHSPGIRVRQHGPLSRQPAHRTRTSGPEVALS